MPGKHRHGTVGLQSPSNVVQSAIGISDGKATMTRLRKLFKPPVYPDAASGAEYSDETMRSAAVALLFSPNMKDELTKPDPLIFPEGVDQTFSKSPNIPADVPTGGGGLPMTAYGPNIAAPGAHADGTVNVDAGDLPNLGLKSDADFQGAPIPLGVDGTKNPATEAAALIEATMKGTQALGGHGDKPGITENKK